MSVGTVKWFDPVRGYGFITPDNGSRDIFVHITAVARSGLAGLREGQKVSFDLVVDRKTGSSKAGTLKLC